MYKKATMVWHILDWDQLDMPIGGIYRTQNSVGALRQRDFFKVMLYGHGSGEANVVLVPAMPDIAGGTL